MELVRAQTLVCECVCKAQIDGYNPWPDRRSSRSAGAFVLGIGARIRRTQIEFLGIVCIGSY